MIATRPPGRTLAARLVKAAIWSAKNMVPVRLMMMSKPRDWLTEPGDGPSLEFEQLLKVFFADHGTKESLLQGIAATRDWVCAENTENVAVARAYRDGEGDFPERLPVHLLVGRFLTDHYDMVLRWTEWATQVVEAWPDDLTTATVDPADFEETVRRAEEIEHRLEPPPPPS